MMTNYTTTEKKTETKRKLFLQLTQKNKALIEFYKSFISLENSLGAMNNSLELLKEQKDERPNEIALGLILKEAYSMNEIFTKIVQNTSFN